MQVASLAAITSSPRGERSNSLMASWAWRRRFRICSAYWQKILPAVVSEIRLPNRSKSCVLSSCSSCRTWALMAGWVR